MKKVVGNEPQHLAAVGSPVTNGGALGANQFFPGGGETPLALEELEEVVAGSDSPENEAVRKELIASLNRFLGELTRQERYVFVRRYWYLDSLTDIAEKTGFSGSKVASILYRLRGRLKKQLIKEELL